MGVVNPAAAEDLTRTELSPAQATAAAELLLDALKNRQGDVMHDALATPVQASVDVKTVQERLDQRMAIEATRVVSVIPGYNTTTIDAVVTTASGDEGMLMVLDEDGKLLAWKWSDRIQPIETTALDFTRDLAAGRWIAARSKMSLQLQEELAPGRPGTQMDQAQPGVRWFPQGQGRCDRPSRRRSAARAGGCRLRPGHNQPVRDL